MNGEIQFLNSLKECRTEKGLSQGELAKAVGVSRNTISSIETGQYSPTARLAAAICIVLERQFGEIFYFNGMRAVPPKISEDCCSDGEHARDDADDEESLRESGEKDFQKLIRRIIEYVSELGWTAEQQLALIAYLVKED